MDKFIELIRYIFIGAIQGITETLPISSSGHLVIMQELIGLEKNDNLTFEILLHFGSLIAIVFFYRKVIIDLVKNFFIYLFKREEDKKADFKYAWLIVVATIPIGVIGLLISKLEIDYLLTNLITVSIGLLFTAAVLFMISKMKRGHKDHTEIQLKDAVYIGLFQALAILPGISRSGSTVSMSLARKLNIDSALRFSFLLFIPAALGATLVDVLKYMKNPGEVLPEPVLAFIAFLTAILFTFISLKIFIDIIKRGKLIYFSYYCLFAAFVAFMIQIIKY